MCDRVAIVDHGRVLASGRIDDLLGDTQLRVRVTDLPATDLDGLARFGAVETDDDDWLTITGVRDEDIPDVVAAIVTAGGRVHAVDMGRGTLEELFMHVVGDTADRS